MAITNSTIGGFETPQDVIGYFNSKGPVTYSIDGTTVASESAAAWIIFGAGWEVWVGLSDYNNGNGLVMYTTSMSARIWAQNWTTNFYPRTAGLVTKESEALVTMNAQTYTANELIPAIYIYRIDISSPTETVLTQSMVNTQLGTVNPNIEYSVTIVDSEDNIIDTIGSNAFTNYQTAINTITFSSKIKEIKEQAFQGCTSLKGKITLPESMTTIGTNAFNGCTNITSVYLPQSITVIGEDAFNNTGLTNVLLFSNTVDIGENAFTSCTKLANVAAPSPPSTNIPTFYSNWSSSGDFFNTGASGTTNSGSIKFSYRVYFTPDSENNITKAIVSEQNSEWNSLDFIAYIADVSGNDTPIHIASDAFTGSLITKLFITGTTPKFIESSAFGWMF